MQRDNVRLLCTVSIDNLAKRTIRRKIVIYMKRWVGRTRTVDELPKFVHVAAIQQATHDRAVSMIRLLLNNDSLLNCYKISMVL